MRWARWLLWTCAIFTIYVVLADKPTPDELTAGACTAAIAALAAVRLHRVAEMTYAPRWRYVRHLASVPAAVLRDTLAVGAVILRSLVDPDALKGHMEERPAVRQQRSFANPRRSISPCGRGPAS